MLTPERALAPFWPRPAVLPSPEPMPRPTRTRDCRAPLLSLISFSFMSLHSLSLLSRPSLHRYAGEGKTAARRSRVRVCRRSGALRLISYFAPPPPTPPASGRGNFLRRLDAHQIRHLFGLAGLY